MVASLLGQPEIVSTRDGLFDGLSGRTRGAESGIGGISLLIARWGNPAGPALPASVSGTTSPG